MFKINNKSINGQYQFLCDRKLRITWHRQNRKSWSRVRIPRPGPIFHLHIIKIWQMKKNTYMHFKEESIIYIWSKFQLDTCMFDSNILLTKFGPGFWFRVPGVGPGFYSFPVFYRVRYGAVRCIHLVKPYSLSQNRPYAAKTAWTVFEANSMSIVNKHWKRFLSKTFVFCCEHEPCNQILKTSI